MFGLHDYLSDIAEFTVLSEKYRVKIVDLRKNNTPNILSRGNARKFRSKIIDGIYIEPELLGPEINSGRSRYNALISSDERFLIVPTYGMEDSFGATDYYISFRDDTDN